MFTDEINTILTARIFHVQLRNVFTKINSSFPTRSAGFLLHSDRQKERKTYTNRERKEIFRFAFRDSLWCLKIAMWFSRRETRWQFLLFKFLVSRLFIKKNPLCDSVCEKRWKIENANIKKYERKISFGWLIRAICLIAFVFKGRKRETSEIILPINQFVRIASLENKLLPALLYQNREATKPDEHNPEIMRLLSESSLTLLGDFSSCSYCTRESL